MMLMSRAERRMSEVLVACTWVRLWGRGLCQQECSLCLYSCTFTSDPEACIDCVRLKMPSAINQSMLELKERWLTFSRVLTLVYLPWRKQLPCLQSCGPHGSHREFSGLYRLTPHLLPSIVLRILCF